MDAAFKKGLNSSVLLVINTIILSGEHVVSLLWGNSSARILRLLIKENVVSADEIYSALHIRLKKLGRDCFEHHKRGEYPDHTLSPEALAYALVNDEFTDKEKFSIRFDGETLEEFVKLYTHGDLRKKILDKLLTEKEPIPPSDSDNHTCHCCC